MSDRRRYVVVAAVLVAAGLGTAALMRAFPERLNVPAAVGYVAATAFVMAGLLALANAFAGARVRAWLVVALLACLVSPGLWEAFGPGDRWCSAGSLVFFAPARGTACRLAFGVASVVGLLMLAIAVRHAWRVSRRGDASGQATRPGRSGHAADRVER